MKFTVKKIKWVLLTLRLCVFVFTLCACTANNNYAVSQKANYNDELLNRDILKVAIIPDHEPFEYISDNNIVGLDVDIINMIAKELNLKVEFYITTLDKVFKDVEKGEECDVAISDLQITEERQKFVFMSNSYYSTKKDGKEENAGIAIGKDKIALYRSINNVIDIKKNNGEIDSIISVCPLKTFFTSC